MKNLFPFFLEGYAHLEGIVHNNDKISACIRTLQMPRNMDIASEEVVLNCEVQTQAVLSILQNLESKRLAGHNIILRFRAVYSHFGYCHSGVAPEDPEYMLVLHSKLEWIEGVVSGSLLVCS